MSIKALRQKKADLIAEAGAMFDAASAAGRGLSADEIARDTAIEAQLGELAGQIQAAERQMERQRGLGIITDGNAAAEGQRAGQAGNGQGTKRFSSLGEQMIAVARAANPESRVTDPRLIYQAGPTGQSEGIGADGGFLVQTDLVPTLLRNTFEGGAIASRITRIGVGAGSNGIKMNGVDETSRGNGSRWGGIRAFWTAEGALKAASQVKFRQIQMELQKLTGLCYATDELLQDATALGDWLPQAFADEFTFQIEDAIVNGSGAGMPLGFLNSGATIMVAKEAGQPGLTIMSDNILKMWSRMPSRSRKNAVWLINQDAEPQLYKFSIAVKNVAGTENVGGFSSPAVTYIPPGMNGNEFGMLMGRPVIPVEYAATLGTAGDIQLVDLSQYLGIDKGGMETAASIHVRFIYDETTFRFVYRFNGQPIWAAPMTPYKGTTTQSPFIVLANRA